MPSVCSWDGCPEVAEKAGRCAAHPRVNRSRSPSSGVTGTSRWRAMKKRLLRKPEFRFCVYCGDRAETLDHRVPVSQNAALAWTESNLVPSCHACNAHKGGRRV